LFTVYNLNNGNSGEKSIYVYLAVLVGFPCPLKITLQCTVDKKVWEPQPHTIDSRWESTTTFIHEAHCII